MTARPPRKSPPAQDSILTVSDVVHPPPSTVSTCAVIQPDSGETRNTTALAMSSGSPMRPIIAPRGKMLLGPLPVRCATPTRRQVGADEAWRHCVHGDVVLAQLHGKAPRQNHHLGLGCRVERIARQGGAHRRDRAYFDDPAVAPRPHAPHYRARRMDMPSTFTWRMRATCSRS